MALSLLHRRIPRLPAGAGGMVPSGTAAWPVRLAEGNSGAGNIAGPGAQPRVLDGHAGHGRGHIFPRRNPGLDADIPLSSSRLQSGVGKSDFRRDRRGRWHPGIAGRRLAGRPPAAEDEGFVLFRFCCQHGPGCASDDRCLISQGSHSWCPPSRWRRSCFC